MLGVGCNGGRIRTIDGPTHAPHTSATTGGFPDVTQQLQATRMHPVYKLTFISCSLWP
jgi:hypothetical protein